MANKHCHLLTQSFRITLKDTSTNISAYPNELSSLHNFYYIFSQTCIFHHDCEKYSNLWCSDKLKKYLQVKRKKERKKESRHFYFLKAKLSPQSLSATPRQRKKYSFHTVHWVDYEMYCFKSMFLKHITEECTFC